MTARPRYREPAAAPRARLFALVSLATFAALAGAASGADLDTSSRRPQRSETVMTTRTAVRLNVLDFGAVGDGATPCTEAFRAAFDAAAAAGGGTVYVPAGRYLTGAITLRSDTALYIDAGATLIGGNETSDFPPIDNHSLYEWGTTHSPLIGGQDLRNIAVLGRGTVDGNGQLWWERKRADLLEHARPRLIRFTDCENVLVEGVTLTNSPSWTVHPVRCNNVAVENITIINPTGSPNTDGINPESCRNVRISGCHIDVGDDCIAIKAGTEHDGRDPARACENITVTGCTMIHGHGGVVIGSEMSSGVRNVAISNCVFDGTDRGIRIKSRRGRGGAVEDVRACNIIMRRVRCPFVMNLYYHCGPGGRDEDVQDKSPRPVDEGTPLFRRIHFSDITATDVELAAGFIHGLPEMPVRDITFDNVEVVLSERDVTPGAPAMAGQVEPMAKAGFFCRYAENVSFRNVRVTGQRGAALDISHSRSIEVSGLDTPTPPERAAIHLEHVENAFIHGCRAPSGTNTFLRLVDCPFEAISLIGNDLSAAESPLGGNE